MERWKNTFDRLFLDYCVLGGMPEVVESYFVKGTFEGVPAMQRRILADYHADVRKYAEGLDPVRILSVFESIPAQLAKENKKFQLATIAKGARYKDYWGCVEWLRDAGVVTVCKAENARAKSLSTLIASDNYRDVHWGIKLVNGNVGYESKVLTIPQWCAFWVPRLAKEFKPRGS